MFGQNWWYKKEKPFYTGDAAGFGGYAFGAPPAPGGPGDTPYVAATGGNQRSNYEAPLGAGPHGPAGVYSFNAFNSSGSLVVPTPGRLLIAVLGGGGAGGWTNDGLGGGGGAGGLALANVFIEAGTYPISIGGGGSAPNNRTSNNGSNTVFAPGTAFEINAYGGGRGATGPRHGRNPGANGGCGGGGHVQENSGEGSSEQPTAPYGASITLNGGSITRYGQPSNSTSPKAGGGTASQNYGTDGQVVPWAPYSISLYSSSPGRASPTNDRYGAGGGGGASPTPYCGLGGGGLGPSGNSGGTGSGGNGGHSNKGGDGGVGYVVTCSPVDGAPISGPY